MAGLCIPKSIVEKLTTAIRSGDIDLDKLYGMSSEEARTLFSNFVGKDNAELVNSTYEKAKLDATKKAAADYVTNSQKENFKQTGTKGEFAKKLLNDEQTKKMNLEKLDDAISKKRELQAKTEAKLKEETDPEAKANLQNKLNKLKDQEERLNARREDTENPSSDRLIKKIQGMKNILGDEDYTDLASAKLGHEVTPAEGKYILDKANELQDLAKGNADSDAGLTADYANARLRLDSYIESLNPNAPLNIIRNLIDIGRNALITGVSTPTKVLLNYTNYFAQRVLARIGSSSGGNGDIIDEMNKNAVEFTKKTGNDYTQFNSKNDLGSTIGSHSGQGFSSSERFDAPQQDAAGKGIISKADYAVGKLAALSHKIAITIEHQLAFNHVFRNTFYDTLKFRSMDMAKLEGKTGADASARAREIIKDANLVEPKTDAGRTLRKAAQEVASMVTNTNDTWLSRISVGIKNGINKMSPDVPVGDLIEPMAKIPANVISNAIKNSPIGLPKAALDIMQGRLKMAESKTIEERYEGLQQYKDGIQHLMGVAGSIGISAIIASNLTKKDFRSDQYGNHFVKFGDVWVNTEYFARIAPTLSGMMGVKMNPKENIVNAFATGKTIGEGALGGLLNLPGADSLLSVIQAGLGKHPLQSLISQVESRVIPSIGTQLWKENPIEHIFFGASGVQTTKEYKQSNEAAAKKAAASRKADKQP